MKQNYVSVVTLIYVLIVFMFAEIYYYYYYIICKGFVTL